MARTQIVENLQIALGASIDKAMGQTLAQWERQNMSAAGKAAASFRSFDAAVGKAHTSIMSFRNLAIAGLVVGLGALVTRSLNAVDAMADAAEAAGLSTTRYQEMRFALQFAGVSHDSFASAMGRFAKTVGEATQGNKEIIETFDRLGVKILDANGNLRTQDAILADTVKGLAGVSEQAKRSADAYQLFGREAGSKFAAAIGQGTAAIDALIAKAREMNIILTEDMVKAGVAAADQMETLGEVISARLNRAVVSVTPAIIALVNAMAWLLEPFEAPGNNLNRIEGVAAALDEIAAKQAGITSGLNAGAARSSPEARQIAADALARQRAALEARLAKLQRDAEFPNGVGAAAGAGARNPTPSGGSKSAERSAEQWLETRRELYDTGQDLMQSNIEAEDAMELAQMTRRMEALAGFENQKFQARQAYEQAVDEMDADRIATERATADRVADAWGNALRGIADDFNILFDRSIDGWDRVMRFAISALEKIAVAAATQMGGGEDPYQQAGGWLARLLDGAFSGGAGAGGNMLPTGGPQYRAEGGPISAGRPTIVGERGPELVVSSRSGTVIPTRALGGSVSQSFVFNVGTGASEAAQVMRAMLPEIERRARSGVERDVVRGRGVIGARG